MNAVGTAVGLAAGLFCISLASYSIAAMTKSGSLRPNAVVGIRTRATQRSQRSWSAGHEAARPTVIGVALISLFGALSTIAAGIALGGSDSADTVVMTLGLSTYVIALGLLVAATIQANRAALAEED